MLNRVILMGRITADPELKTTNTGVSVTSFSIAVDRNYVKQGEERKADFFNIVCWRSTAEFVCRYFGKGSLIAVEGQLQSRQFQAKDGSNRYVVEVVADNVSFTGERRDNNAGGYNQSYGGNQSYGAPSYGETMRRQNYEFQVSRPQVITKMIDGKLHEPMEFLIIEVPDTYVGPVMEKLGSRKGELINMGTREGGVTHIEFRIPSRGLMGYRPEFLTDTNGNGIMNHVFDGYEPYKGEIVTRHQGSLIAFETGETVTYGLYAAQERGRLFIGPGVPVYEGMIVGASPKSEDITVNVCKKKHITNTRASGSDDALKLTPPTIMSLEQCLEFIADDELVEVTPENIRMRKRILSKEQRMKQAFRKK